jgi:hypothetical protein
MKEAGLQPALNSVFGGTFAQQIISRESVHRSEREEAFDTVCVGWGCGEVRWALN